MKIKSLLLICSFLLMSANVILANSGDKPGEVVITESTESKRDVSDFNETPQEKEQRLKWWREARFGIFIHWGPVSVMGYTDAWSDIGWSRDGARPGLDQYDYPKGTIPVVIYDNLYKVFDPIRFNANQWISLFKESGAGYIVFTTKHADDFSMFDSQYSDYKITSPESPYKKDITKMLSDACSEQDMPFGVYYCPMSWPNPNYLNENHHLYVEYMHNQIKELCTNYGKVVMWWSDGPGPAEKYKAKEAETMIRKLQPGIILNDRLCGIPGDYYTPEGFVGAFNRENPWETCMVMNDQWSFRNLPARSFKHLLDKLVQCVGGDGNLLLNIGPKPDGTIPEDQADRLKQFGKWLKKYGESIYGTRGGPFKPERFYVSTCKGNKIYVHMLSWKYDTVELPPIPAKILDCTLLTGGTVKFKQSDDQITITVPKEHQDELDTIAVLTIDQDAVDIKPVDKKSGSLSLGKKACASTTCLGEDNPKWQAANAFDDEPRTRWAADSTKRKGWLQVDLGEPMVVNRAMIREAYSFTGKYELKYKDGDAWVVIHTGTHLGDWGELQFEPVKAQIFRLEILKAHGSPTMMEFQLFNDKK